MAVLDFPANPVLNQEYNFPPFRYRWDGEKWRTIGTGANPVQTQIAEHRVEKDAHAIETITGLREELSALGGTPVLSVVWVQLRTEMWPGYVPADGQTLSRADYADAWEAVKNKKVPVVADSDWLTDTNARGAFTEGDGSTTFRIPDYNGKFAGSKGSCFLRGDGLNSGDWHGFVQGDAIREIEGTVAGVGGGYNRAYDLGMTGDGVFARQNTGGYDLGDIKGVQSPDTSKSSVMYFKASHVVPTAADNRPVNVTGCWAVKLAGAAQNAGQIDALALATQLANLDAKLSAPGLAFVYGLNEKTFPANSKTWISFQTTSIIKRNVSVPDNESFVIAKADTGIYKMTASLTAADSNSRQMPQVFGVVIRGGTVIAEKLILLGYTPTNGSGMQDNGFNTSSGSVYFSDIKVGDVLKFRLDATNNANVNLYHNGTLTIEEV